MPLYVEKNELALMLARAFDAAWELYYLPHRSGTLSEHVARPLLARHLVALAKGGLTDEAALVTAGLERLTSLTPALEQIETPVVSPAPYSPSELQPQTLHSELHQASASFLAGWRIPSRRLG